MKAQRIDIEILEQLIAKHKLNRKDRSYNYSFKRFFLWGLLSEYMTKSEISRVFKCDPSNVVNGVKKAEILKNDSLFIEITKGMEKEFERCLDYDPLIKNEDQNINEAVCMVRMNNEIMQKIKNVNLCS